MADVDDIHNISQAVQRQWGDLEDADIDERDRDAIERWTRHRRVHSDTYSTHTGVADMSKTRMAAERADVPLDSKSIGPARIYWLTEAGMEHLEDDVEN